MSDIGKQFDDGLLTRDEYERVEALYLKAVTALLDAAGVEDLTVSEVHVSQQAAASAQAVREGTLLTLSEAVEICRMQLREQVSCRLDDGGGSYVHVGFDYYVHVGVPHLSESALAAIEESGLFVERGFPAPYADLPD